MKRKILWCWLSLLLVAALVLASCGPKEEVVKKGELYGGTITGFQWLRGGAGDPPSWDTCDGMWFATMWVGPHLENILSGDFEKYGPRGTGEYAFNSWSLPEEFLRGLLCDSWEVTPTKVIFHIRQGVYWAAEGREHVMARRELTAEDIAFSLNRCWNSPGGSQWPTVNSIYAEGDTCVVELPYHANWPQFLGHGTGSFNKIYCPEVVEAGASDWKNQVGTGPFILTDYVVGSSVTWERNPDYWDTTTINGKEYQLPFIDKFVVPIIPDGATQIASLRTGKLDYFLQVDMKYAATLVDTTPELKMYPNAKEEVIMLALQTATSEYFKNRDIRRAMMIGTDLKAIRDAIWSGGAIHSFPIASELPTSVYTPVDQLPASTQELFTYDPVKAKLMLADAGYPDGFTVELVTQTTAVERDLGSMIKAQWSKIGVTVDLKPVEAAVWSQLRTTHEYKDVMTVGEGTSSPVALLGLIGAPGGQANEADYYNPDYIAGVDKAMATLDIAERNALFKEMAILILDDVPYIGLAGSCKNSYFWPWLKNHYGETAAQYGTEIPIVARMWIDQAMRKEMGY